MDTSLDLPLLELILSSATGLLETRYFAGPYDISKAVALVCALWDHSITFNNEVKYIWKKQTSIATKVL
ncbi:hypothetical protein EIP86_006012 [Pleurotus ostreatoroseus]|nr:hypothetical protein EIP86_006012 [Pleurotus ostreatoroseus]